MHPSSQHVIAAAVALAVFGAGMNEGAYAPGFLAGAAFAVWWLVLVCVGLRLAPREGISREAILCGGCLALLAAWTALSWVWAGDDGAVFVEIVRALFYLGLFGLVIIVSGREGARPWLGGLAIGLTAVALAGLASRFDPSIGGDAFPGSRLNYPIGYWNGLATCAALAIVLLAWHAVAARTRLARSLATAALPLPALAIFLSGSRGGVAAAAVGLALLFALLRGRFALIGCLLVSATGGLALILFANGQPALLEAARTPAGEAQGKELLLVAALITIAVGVARHYLDPILRDTRVSPLARRGAVAIGVIALVGLVVAEDPAERLERFKEPPKPGDTLPVSGNFTSDNGSGRYQFWDAAIDALGEQPLHGIGAGQYQSWWNQHGSIAFNVLDAHSLVLETAAELGVVGLALVLLFLAVCVRAGWARRAGAAGPEVAALLSLLGAGVLSASIDWMWEFAAVFAPVVIAAALLTGRATAGERAGWVGEGIAAGRRRTAIVATALVAWVALWCSGDLLLTELKLDESRAAAGEGRLPAAAESANEAIAIAPWDAEPRLQFALVRELQGDLPAARQSLLEAAERAPDDWRIWFALRGVELKSHRVEAARAAIAKALRANPRSPFLRRSAEES